MLSNCFSSKKKKASFSYWYNLCLRFVSSLPLTDFQFTMSLSHDVPLATTLGQCIYVLGSIQRTGEKLLLQYNTKKGAYIWKKATKLSKKKPGFISSTESSLLCVLLSGKCLRFTSSRFTFTSCTLIHKWFFWILSFSIRCMVWTASHPYQSQRRSPYTLLPGGHGQAACDWWQQLRECGNLVLCGVTEMGAGKQSTNPHSY